jgi:phosphatidylglycerol:prolipoprotein diacylglycerol transferase
MRPTLWSIGELDFHAYNFMLCLAFLITVLRAVGENYKLEKPYPITPIVGLWIFVSALFGARLWHILQYGELSELYTAFFILQGGLVFYGGLLGGLTAGIVYMKWKKVPLLPMGDIAFPYVALGVAITRLGCFLNGCCWGAPTNLPWGITFPSASAVYRNFNWIRNNPEDNILPNISEAMSCLNVADHTYGPVHPTQLYNVVGLALIFVFMRWVYKRPHRPGTVMFLFPLLYGISRFTTEIFRGDSVQSVAGMTVSQTVSLALIILGLTMSIYLRTKKEKEILEQD